MKTYTLSVEGSVSNRIVKIRDLTYLCTDSTEGKVKVFGLQKAKEFVEGKTSFVTENEDLAYAIYRIVGLQTSISVSDPEQEQKEREEEYERNQRAVDMYGRARIWYETLTDEQKEFVQCLHPGPATASCPAGAVYESSTFNGIPVLIRIPPLSPAKG